MDNHVEEAPTESLTENRKTQFLLTVVPSSSFGTESGAAVDVHGTPKSPFMTRIMMAADSPVLKAVRSMRMYLEEVGLPKLNPQEAWLPITESRNGNAYYAAFHTLSSGIGIPALLLPIAFTALGWIWGIFSLCLAFIWQLYTLWLLIQLHEPIPGAAVRYSRYLQLSMAAFGEKKGKLMALFPIMYLSGGTCVTLIIIGGGTLKIFFDVICGGAASCDNLHHRLSTLEWYIVFTCAAILLAQHPNLNSIAGVSLIGAFSAVTFCTLIWVVSVLKDRPAGVTYGLLPDSTISEVGRFRKVLNALGIIAFAFRGHNLVLEIQGTMPSSSLKPSRVPMWKGVKFSYLIIGMCLFPLAIGGYWSYGQLVPSEGGMLIALVKYHKQDTSRLILGLASLLIVVHSLMSFQIYAMVVFDNLEMRYTSRKQKACPWWVRTGLRLLFGGFGLFISVAVPFLPSLAGLIGGVALPVTMAYPCLMWVMMKKPDRFNGMWWFNWGLGGFGILLSVLVLCGAIWTIVADGIDVHFFKPR
ncbi:lysine histidine transporter-like 8 [Impatiens glandulifera]|uniref:lysine histidine transporter-like 8 n=1 Tax=Impatiens glandulifera TaxID=253017 RepID=UPI001FB186BE|nr:lysine histidine transporter-like 8 [Impatiens glandulifera]